MTTRAMPRRLHFGESGPAYGSGMSTPNENALASTFAERCAQARSHLRREMEACGLHERDGWGIVERIRAIGGRTALVMRPLHLYLDAPDGLECVVEIDEDEKIDMHCEPEL